MKYLVINTETGEHEVYNNQKIANFLEVHLDKFGDENQHILKAIEYSLDFKRGGFIVLGLDRKHIFGVVVVNETGMGGYIPENILVYIAVDNAYRGKGFGKSLMQEALKNAKGAVALHVEPNNPAKILYEKLGFTNKYLEMRYQPQ